MIRLAATLLAAVALAAPATASAEAVSAAELTALAGDPAARERLLAVDRVDGRPVDARAIFAGASGEEAPLRARVLVERLEREADRAERDGEWERAVRLRFRAGLLRLDDRRVIAYRPSLTTGEVARSVGSPAFREVGERFDAIAYGGRTAEREDAEHARRGWAEVLTR